MNKEMYKEIVKKYTPKEDRLKNAMIAFFIGGLLGLLGQILKARCGLIVPITGFAHAMMSTTLEYRKEGMITGIGTNMLKLAGSVIVFGVVSAYTFGIIRYIIFGG